MVNLRLRRPARTGLLKSADFVRFWTAEAVSQFGSQVSQLALPLLAALMLDASAFEMGVLAASGTLPNLIFGLHVGVWVDRLRRRPIMIAADFGRAALLMLIPLASLLDFLSIPFLVVVAFCVGTLTVCFDVSYMSYLPTLVDQERLIEANSKLEASASIAQVAGPGLAGFLVGLVTAPFAIMIDACSFLVSALFLRKIEQPEPQSKPREQAAPIRQEIAEGLRLVYGHPVLRALAGCGALISLAGNAFLAVYVLYMQRDLGLSATEIGFVFAVGGVGAFIGSLLSGWVTARIGQGRAMIVAQIAFGITGLVIPLAVLAPSIALPMVVFAEFAQWLALIIYFVNAMSMRQAITPDALRGRVNASFRIATAGMWPIGALLGGVLGSVIGLPETLALTELILVLPVTWLLMSPLRRNEVLSVAIPEGIVIEARDDEWESIDLVGSLVEAERLAAKVGDS
jgi:MFS family permease